MRVLITGGAGFIGSALTKALSRANNEVICIDNLTRGKKANIDAYAAFVEADVLREDMAKVLLHYRPEAVVHLAAQIHVWQSAQDPVVDAEQNVLGTLRLLAAAQAAKTKTFVLASSGGAVYGNNAPRPTPETFSPCEPLSPYGASKLGAELYVELYGRLGPMRTATLRLGNVFGPGQSTRGESGVVALFFKALLEKRVPKLFAGGSQTRDYVFIDDIVDAFMRVLNASAARGLYNIGTGRETSVREVLQLVCRTLGCEPHAEELSRRSFEIEHSCLDAGRASRELFWQPTWSLEAGLRATLDAMARVS